MLHFKRDLGSKLIGFFWLSFVPYHKVKTNSVINKIINENKKFTELNKSK